jgi:selenide,water dikinase
VLRRLQPRTPPDLLVGTEWGDDAAVWRRPDGRALVATVDFFTPIVDDPRVWGAVAAANSASDVYAMGGYPLFALNVVAWPQSALPIDLLGDVLEGAAEVADRGGWVVVGGHTVDGAEPLYGQAVIGEADPARLLVNDAARPGEALVLTKAIGTGLLATAVKRSPATAIAPGGRLASPYRAAVASMTRLNDEACRVALEVGSRAATDVTGFGLLGHLHKLLAASGLSADLHESAIPLLDGALDLLAEGQVPGGTARNLSYVEPFLEVHGPVRLELLADPQTSGGLLFTCAEGRAGEAVGELRASGHAASVIGVTRSGPAGQITVAAGAAPHASADPARTVDVDTVRGSGPDATPDAERRRDRAGPGGV